jgi:hypothetical protein
MLRASIETRGRKLTPRPLVSGFGETGVAHGAEIIAFVDSVVLRDEYEIDVARAALDEAIGTIATDRVAMVAGNFSMMNRALDATGARLGPGHAEVAAELGLEVPAHLSPE